MRLGSVASPPSVHSWGYTTPAPFRSTPTSSSPPHHGSANGSCLDFIQRVNPDRVVFPAGHEYGHPAFSTAKRYFLAGVDKCHMLRTDRGDDEGQKKGEWFGPAQIDRHRDPISDDDILITLSSAGATAVYTDKLGDVADCPAW